MWSTNGEYFKETTNNVSVGLIHAGSGSVYGFSLAPFNNASISVQGAQLGGFNTTQKLSGVQLGFANSTTDINGVQFGFFNGTEKSKGIQIGGFNYQKSGGVQIGLVNVSDDNKYPIGLINIVRNGDKNVGVYIDEMSNVMATFRSGGRYLYGIVGLGVSFSSSEHHFVIEGGVGGHLHLTKSIRIDTEIVVSSFSVPMTVRWGETEEEMEERKKDHDFREAFRISARIFPCIRFGKHIEMFGGPSVNYLHSNNVKNEKMFPSHYWRRNFKTSCFKQIHLGWIAGIQYRF